MVYKMNTYQNPKNKKQNNDVNKSNNDSDFIEKKSIYNSRRDSNSTYSKISQYSYLTAKPSLKGGVTTVIQHYSGRRRQYEQYNKNGSKK